MFRGCINSSLLSDWSVVWCTQTLSLVTPVWLIQTEFEYIEFKINSEKTLTCKNIKIYYLGCSHSYSGMFLSRLFILPFSTVNCMRMLVIEDKVAIYINSNHFNFLYAVVYRKVLSIDLSKTKTGTK